MDLHYNPKAAILWDGGNNLDGEDDKVDGGDGDDETLWWLRTPHQVQAVAFGTHCLTSSSSLNTFQKRKVGVGEDYKQAEQRIVQIVKVYDSPSPNITLSPASTLLLLYPFYSLHYTYSTIYHFFYSQCRVNSILLHLPPSLQCWFLNSIHITLFRHPPTHRLQ